MASVGFGQPGAGGFQASQECLLADRAGAAPGSLGQAVHGGGGVLACLVQPVPGQQGGFLPLLVAAVCVLDVGLRLGELLRGVPLFPCGGLLSLLGVSQGLRVGGCRRVIVAWELALADEARVAG